jgi:hypothetical protein
MLQNMQYAWVIIFLSITSVQAGIYRSVDAEGNVVFTDEPSPGAEKIEISPSTVISSDQGITSGDEETDDILKLSPEGESQTFEPEADAIPSYQIRIIAPADDESIWVNNGNVSVSMIVEPQLDAERGDLIVLNLDGADVGPAQPTTTFQLNNLSRGTHTVSATVVDRSGSALTSSETVTFHLHRTSVLNKPAQKQAN